MKEMKTWKFKDKIYEIVDANARERLKEIEDNGVGGNVSEEDIAQAVDKYLEENPIEGGSGTTDYIALENKPSINGVELNGNKTSADLGIGNPTDEQVASAVSTWLDENPEATTTVADKSINPDKTTWLRQVFHNIFNPGTIEDGRYFFSGTNANTTGGGTANYFISDFIPVEGGKQYYFNFINAHVKAYDSNKEYVTTIITGSKTNLIEVPSDTAYIRFSVSKTVVTTDTAQVYEYLGEVWEYDTYMNLYDTRISSDSYTKALVELVKQEIEKGNVDIGELISLENIPFKKMEGFDEWHWQLVDPTRFEEGTLNTSGEETGGASNSYVYIRTPFIPVTEGETLYFMWATVYGYDSEGNFVSKITSTSGVATVPEGVTQIRACSYASENPFINIYRRGYGKHDLGYSSEYDYSNGFPIFKSNDGKEGFKSYLGIYPWADKKFCFIGDSFTAPGVWNKNMTNNLKGVYGGSEAVSGGAFADYDGVPKTAYEQAQNFVTNGWNPDVILITLGTNDEGNEITLGEIVKSTSISDFDLTTYTGGMQACLNYLQNNFPNAIIYIGWTPMGGLSNANSEYIERMKEVALAYGIEYIETRTCGVTTLSEIYADCYESGTSGGHPTGAGQIKIGEYMTRLLTNKR